MKKRKRPGRHIRRARYGNVIINPEIPLKQKKAVIESHFDDLSKELKKEGKVRIKGFGIFKIKKIPAKHIPAKPKGMRLNPFTGKEQMFPASKAKTKPASHKIKFFPSKDLKEI